jgi:hypothetical protein
VNIPVQSFVKTFPGLASVSTAVNATFLHANIDGSYNLRVWGNKAHMRDMRRRWKSPLLIARNLSYGLTRRPAFPAVLTHIEQGWGDSQVQPSLHTGVGGKRPYLLFNRMLVHQQPIVLIFA